MKLKAGDIIIIAVSLLFAAAVALTFWQGHSDGTAVEISINGQVVQHIALPAYRTVTLEDVGVTVVIDGNSAYISESDCPDQYCIKQGRLSTVGAAAVCLPNRVIVKITGEDAPDIVVG